MGLGQYEVLPTVEEQKEGSALQTAAALSEMTGSESVRSGDPRQMPTFVSLLRMVSVHMPMVDYITAMVIYWSCSMARGFNTHWLIYIPQLRAIVANQNVYIYIPQVLIITNPEQKSSNPQKFNLNGNLHGIPSSRPSWGPWPADGRVLWLAPTSSDGPDAAGPRSRSSFCCPNVGGHINVRSSQRHPKLLPWSSRSEQPGPCGQDLGSGLMSCGYTCVVALHRYMFRLMCNKGIHHTSSRSKMNVIIEYDHNWWWSAHEIIVIAVFPDDNRTQSWTIAIVNHPEMLDWPAMLGYQRVTIKIYH